MTRTDEARERFACPVCRAEAGMWCRRITGGLKRARSRMSTVHPARIRLLEKQP